MRNKLAPTLGAIGLVIVIGSAVQAQDAVPTAPATAPSADANSANLTLGGQVVLRLRAAAGGMTPQQRVDVINGRLSGLLSHPKITPADVVVYTPTGQAPVIYALGHRLITVDAATVQAAGGGKPLTVATQWAKRLQQVLPRVNYRPSNMPEPTIPADPPLTITADFAKVGGAVGAVTLRNKVVIRLRGPQPGGMTAAERADIITARLARAADKTGADATDPVQVVQAPEAQTDDAAAIVVDGTTVLTVEPSEAKAAHMTAPEQLATAWAKNIRAALGLPEPPHQPASPAVPAPAPS